MNRSLERTTTRAWASQGALGGLIAGMVMAMVAMLYTLIAQGDLLDPLKQMGAAFFPADSGSLASLVAGLVLHMMMAIAFGIVFALLTQDRIGGFGPLVIAGMIFIAVEWAIARFVVLPALDRPLVATFGASGGILAHLMFGVVLGGWLAWRSAPFTTAAASPAQRRTV
jgi:hypothetical protein